jgi:Holliday junction resolvase
VSYQRGRDREYQAQRKLEAMGYTVIRSAGSKSPVDLTAFSNEEVLLIQVKSISSGKPRKAEREKLLSFPAPSFVRKQFWIKLKRGWDIIEVG